MQKANPLFLLVYSVILLSATKRPTTKPRAEHLNPEPVGIIAKNIGSSHNNLKGQFRIAANARVNWLNFADVALDLQKEKRPVLIDVYTDWCGWCKVMDNKTYSNKKVGDYLGNKFYAVKFNAETKDDIVWEGKTYHYNAQYRCNEFALYLTQGQLAFPTTVIIPADGSQPQAIPGYLPTKDFETIVKYFGENEFGKTPFDQYQKNFKPVW